MTRAGYSEAGRILTKRTGRLVTRQQIRNWNARRTVNAAGQMFPSPVWADPDAKPRQPRLYFDVEEIEHWMRPGVPFGPHRSLARE